MSGIALVLHTFIALIFLLVMSAIVWFAMHLEGHDE